MKKCIMAISLLFGFSAIADTTIDPAHPYAYSANTGWINARADGTNGAVIGRYFCSGSLYSANLGWISLGTGAPANGYAYDNQSANDFGVNHDETGALRGYAYGANTGWISLSNAQAFVRTERLDDGPDSDADGLPDACEYSRYGNLTALSGSGDLDADGLADRNMGECDFGRVERHRRRAGVNRCSVHQHSRAFLPGECDSAAGLIECSTRLNSSCKNQVCYGCGD